MINYEVICPEMGEKIPDGTTVEATIGGGIYLKTFKELYGRGIRFAGRTDIGTPKNTYHVTKIAFDKLCKTENIAVVVPL